MRDFTNWNGQIVKKLILSGDFPEYSYLINMDGSYVPHDSPYHGETIFDHVWRVADEASKLSKRFKLSENDHHILMIASTWHDVGKIFCRKEKTRLICDVCGKPHSESYNGKCKNIKCHGYNFTPKIVMGYANHEKIAVKDWLFGNISKREEFSADICSIVKTLILNHLDVLSAVKKEDLSYPFTKLNLLLSWADEKGRDQPLFDDPNTDKFNRIYRLIE